MDVLSLTTISLSEINKKKHLRAGDSTEIRGLEDIL